MNATTGPRRGKWQGRRSGHQHPRRKTGRWSHIYGALDLGTNNCRLLVAKPNATSFRVIDSFSRIVRLGEGVSKTGLLSDDAMDRTMGALRICAAKMHRRGVTRMRCVATEVCRKAENSMEFLERVSRESGIELDIITTQEEAGLAVEGCSPLLDHRNRHALVFDIGGGSTELVWLRLTADGGTEKLGWMSIPYGVVTLTERHGGHHISKQAYEDMMTDIDHYIDRFESEFGIAEQVSGQKVQMLGTSGTVTTLAGIQFGLRRYNRRHVDGAWLDSSDVIRICRNLARSDYEARVAQPCIGKERADLVVSGCAIVEAMHRKWPVEKMRVADRGVREGLLQGLMSAADGE